jgi:hypothetical protein
MSVDPPTACPAPGGPVADGPGLSRAARGAIALGAFVAVFLGSLLLLAEGVGVLAKLALALPLVVVGVTAGLAVVRPGDGWTAAPARSSVSATSVDSTSIRRDRRSAPQRAPRHPAASTSRHVWYFLPLLPGCLLAGVLLAVDRDLIGPIRAALLISTVVLTVVVVVALLRHPRRVAAAPLVLPPMALARRPPIR